MKDTMSVLLDGECSDAELDQILAEMERDPALGQRFSRLVLAREARSGTRIRSADPDFSKRVIAALQNETAVVVPFAGRVRRMPWRMAASLAAAAGVGAAAVLVVQPQAGIGPAEVPAATQTVAATTATAVPVSAEPVETQFAELEDEQSRQLRNYLMAYSQSRGQQGMGSTLGYARYAAYNDAAPTAQTTELKK